MDTNNKCNVGFIGCGQLMTNQHIANAHRSAVCRIHTLCDIDVPKMMAVAKQYPPIKTTANYREMLADPEVQLVVIAMQADKHAALAIEALKAGKDVYVEKPMGVTLSECKQIARVVKQTGRRLTTGFNRRFAPAYVDLLPYLKSRKTGLTIYYRISDFERWQRADDDRILHELVHIFDILSLITGAEPTRIYANQSTFHNNTILTLSYADQSIATILSAGQSGPIPKEHLEIVWESQAIEVDAFVETHYYHIPGAPLVKRFPGRISDKSKTLDYVQAFGEEGGLDCLREILRESTAAYDDYLAGKLTREQVVANARGYVENKGWAGALDEMALSILEKRAPRNATATDGVRAVALAQAARRSIVTGRAVALDPKQWTV